MEVTCPYHWKLIKIIYRIHWGAQEKDIQIKYLERNREKAIKDMKEEQGKS